MYSCGRGARWWWPRVSSGHIKYRLAGRRGGRHYLQLFTRLPSVAAGRGGGEGRVEESVRERAIPLTPPNPLQAHTHTHTRVPSSP